MIPRLGTPATSMKLTHRLIPFLPRPLRLSGTIPARLANPRFLHTPISTSARRRPISRVFALHLSTPSPSTTVPSRAASTTSPITATADVLIEQITDLYNTARDEFEIAAEETEKKSTYGPEDREAAHQAFGELKGVYDEVVAGGEEVGKEVERRVGGRIRELEHALKNMDELAMED